MFQTLILNLGICYLLICMNRCCQCSMLNDKVANMLGRTDLICPDICLITDLYFEDDMECCMCLARPYWSHNTSYVITLTVTFDQEAVPKITSLYALPAFDFYKVIHKNSNLIDIPGNVCNFSSIVFIDFSFNAITNIRDLSCLVSLDTLILKHNKIQNVNNSLLLVMKNLRVLDLSYNSITYLEPGLLSNMNGSLAVIDLSFNRLKLLDISNVLWHNQPYFCSSNFSHNQLEQISNELNWKCTITTDLYHGGFVDFTHNNFTEFLDFHELGFEDITLLGKVFYYSFVFGFNKFICDCRFYHLLTTSAFVLNIFDKDNTHLICNNPPQFKGRHIRSFINEPHLLICNISVAEKCPPGCHCFNQPARNITVVNCQSALVSQNIPRVLPDFNNLVIDFSYNGIHDLERHLQRVISNNSGHYLNRLKEMNLSFNRITKISTNILSLLKDAEIDLRDNKITDISKHITAIYPCNIKLGVIYKSCSCDDVWLQSWLNSSSNACYNNSIIFCNINGKYISIEHLSREELGCFNDSYDSYILKAIAITLGVIMGFVIILSCLVFNFRTEIYILTRQVLKRKRETSSSFTYDVYVCCNEQNFGIRHWISNYLLPLLKHNRIRVFLPYRDFLFGKPREEEIINAISKSRNVLIVLSEKCDASGQSWILYEWKYAWLNYRQHWNKNIIIVNYDTLNHKKVSDRHIKAFLRLGMFIDLPNIDNEIGKVITTKLSPPNVDKYNIEFRNRKPLFSPQLLNTNVQILSFEC